MSSAIVVEALGLVTWWGLGRLLAGGGATGRGHLTGDAGPGAAGPTGELTHRPALGRRSAIMVGWRGR